MYAAVFDLEISAFDYALDLISGWLKTHSAVHGLLNAEENEWFSLDRSLEEGLIAQLAISVDRMIVAGRLMHRENGDPARSWRTEFTLERDTEAAWLAVRIWFSGLENDSRSCKPPRFISRLWRDGLLSDGYVFDEDRWEIKDHEDARWLTDLIEDEQRDFPVVLISSEGDLDPDRLAKDMIGFAHVAIIYPSAVTHLAQQLGPDHILNRGAVRTYYPRVQGRELFAPAARAETIRAWQIDVATGPLAFVEWLVNDVSTTVTRRAFNNGAHRSYESVKAAAIDGQRRVLAGRIPDIESLSNSLELASREVDYLKQQNEDLQKQVQYQSDLEKEYENDNKVLSVQVREKTSALHRLREQNSALSALLRAKNGESSDTLSTADVEAIIASQPKPRTVLEAVERADIVCQERGAEVVFSDVAFDSAADSPFKRPEDVLAALLRLAFFLAKRQVIW